MCASAWILFRNVAASFCAGGDRCGEIPHRADDAALPVQRGEAAWRGEGDAAMGGWEVCQERDGCPGMSCVEVQYKP